MNRRLSEVSFETTIETPDFEIVEVQVRATFYRGTTPSGGDDPSDIDLRDVYRVCDDGLFRLELTAGQERRLRNIAFDKARDLIEY